MTLNHGDRHLCWWVAEDAAGPATPERPVLAVDLVGGDPN